VRLWPLSGVWGRQADGGKEGEEEEEKRVCWRDGGRGDVVPDLENSSLGRERGMSRRRRRRREDVAMRKRRRVRGGRRCGGGRGREQVLCSLHHCKGSGLHWSG
jgi:hypothetical protein